MVTSDEIEKNLTNNESGDDFSDVNSDDGGRNKIDHLIGTSAHAPQGPRVQEPHRCIADMSEYFYRTYADRYARLSSRPPRPSGNLNHRDLFRQW
ncbi:hypothetical protein TNCV_3502971 [Trichonephila clavipes]|uniref:Uncharacterized protein n=1 Tax=Trichonephila clavipes TaxID=2585209 RepID=A0A8X6RYB0_TRICX|nr:hypothetical protein TNCV_3502971 [Trichonephila clavipes]